MSPELSRRPAPCQASGGCTKTQALPGPGSAAAAPRVTTPPLPPASLAGQGELGLLRPPRSAASKCQLLLSPQLWLHTLTPRSPPPCSPCPRPKPFLRLQACSPRCIPSSSVSPHSRQPYPTSREHLPRSPSHLGTSGGAGTQALLRGARDVSPQGTHPRSPSGSSRGASLGGRRIRSCPWC